MKKERGEQKRFGPLNITIEELLWFFIIGIIMGMVIGIPMAIFPMLNEYDTFLLIGAFVITILIWLFKVVNLEKSS